MYRQIWRQAQRPTHLLLEITAYPLAWLTADLHQYHPDVFDLFTLTGKLNLLASLAGSEREPYSLSLFWGQLLSFVYMDTTDSIRYSSGGVCGWVLTKGWVEIFDNYPVHAHWYRLEWKLKGGVDYADVRHKWEIKIGYRWYGLPWMDNDFLLAFKREKFSPNNKEQRWYDNSRVELELHLPSTDLHGGCSYAKYILGKVFPYKKYLLGTSLGVCYERRKIYTDKKGTANALSEHPKQIIWSFIFQPLLIRW